LQELGNSTVPSWSGEVAARATTADPPHAIATHNAARKTRFMTRSFRTATFLRGLCKQLQGLKP
jgi:hypothetical protein